MPTQPLQLAGMIRVGATRGLDVLLNDFGGNTENIFKSVNIYPDLLADTEECITLEQYALLLEEAAIEAKNQNFGFVFGSRFDTRMLGPIGYILHFSKTVGEALDIFCRNFSCLQDNSVMTVECSGDLCRLSYKIHDVKNYRRAQDAETTIGMMQAFLRRAIGDDWHCTEALFEHSQHHDDGLKRQFLGVNPRYKSETNAFTFPARFLQAPIKTHDPLLFSLINNRLNESITRHATRVPFASKIQRFIWQCLREEREVTLNDVAGDFGVSARVIQDRLVGTGTSFRKLKSEAIMDFAADILPHSQCSITEVALKLGFSESSVLSRAFKVRFGCSPREYRKRVQES